ncbi:DUF1127 domain-containing protein [Kosakonia pseudosacchari]|uniref:DUF1127 domain-containing protein n=1 Tax=Kosakonia pseudosacchari TaxID=1646340 RepID=A0ABX4IPR7_9ENTR|nr:DUF1127 domain-containing protein [Kosakonia pseudosacchari]PDO84966.1 DUF1127 domain-containing protein [Kosakonia pseudosacchari]QOV64653.1 DUF1127 domain-containing protein [Kosakonia pseudosacchari]
MEFFENRPNRPFLGFVLLWRKLQRLHERVKTRRLLRALSDEQLKDLGLRRSEL